jgi:tRNA (guanine37-N1)-methyltransferase
MSDALTPAPWTAMVLTLFPAMFPGSLGQSLAGRALETGLWRLETLDIREFARDKHRSVDDAPFGGGAGMVMRPDVLDRAIRAAHSPERRLIYLSPRGRLLTQDQVGELSRGAGMTLVCGRFEGVDERVLAANAVEEMSIGDYVLSGGEPGALVLIDACVRLLPGVMGNDETQAEESFAEGLLEYPHYTRPALWRDAEGREWAAPEVLLSGDHGKVAAWRRSEAERLTRARRPDLWREYLDRQAGATGVAWDLARSE